MKTIKNIKYILPILMSFFVMSFCDLVGIGVDRVKPDFHLSDTLAQLIPSAVFVWSGSCRRNGVGYVPSR